MTSPAVAVPLTAEDYRRYLGPLVLDPLPEFLSGLTHPLAQLLFVLTEVVLGPRPTPSSGPVPEAFRCVLCHSPNTRMKNLQCWPSGLAPIQGFQLRCRVCGGLNVIVVTDVRMVKGI